MNGDKIVNPLRKPAVTQAPLHELVRERWSPRSFAADPVSTADLRTILEAGRWAASTNNSQPWRWIVAPKDDPDRYAKALACFAPKNQRWAVTAPALLFSVARMTFEANGKPNAYAWHDCGQALAQMMLQANALGLVVHVAGGIEPDKVRETFATPAGYEVVCGIAIGRQGDPDALPEELPAREREARTRKPLEQLAMGRGLGAAGDVFA